MKKIAEEPIRKKEKEFMKIVEKTVHIKRKTEFG